MCQVYFREVEGKSKTIFKMFDLYILLRNFVETLKITRGLTKDEVEINGRLRRKGN